MFDNLVSIENISYILVFVGGLLSFLSPCVIPLIPIYMSYLAGNAKQIGEDGQISYKRTSVFLHTMFFVLGISFAFFLLGMAFTALGTFFTANQLLFTRIGGIIIITFGLYQLGLLNFKFLQKERKIRLNLGNRTMNPLAAFIMGFTFSFAWTPCVGPALSSVLIFASGAKSVWIGNLLILLYTAGFIIPFLLLGLFTTQLLNFLRARQKILKYTVRIGGVILIIIGIMTFTGWMNGISKYLNKISPSIGTKQEQQDEDVNSNPDFNDNSNNPVEGDSKTEKQSKDEKEVIPSIDFTLTDQYGDEHTLSDYKGKVVFLNFWATWCPPCVMEMPDIEEIYNEYGMNQEDVVILGVANPSSDEYPNNADESKENIISFLNDNSFTYPVVFDETGDLFRSYYISAFPTTYLIDMDGNIYGHAVAMLSKDMMKRVIQQTIDATE